MGSKTTIYLSLGLHKERSSYRRSLSSQKRPSNTSKHELLSFFPTFVGHFCPPGSGSGSTDPIESGSNQDPDSQPWYRQYHTVLYSLTPTVSLHRRQKVSLSTSGCITPVWESLQISCNSRRRPKTGHLSLFEVHLFLLSYLLTLIS